MAVTAKSICIRGTGTYEEATGEGGVFSCLSPIWNSSSWIKALRANLIDNQFQWRFFLIEFGD
jgi:hypothetical protein